MRLWWRLAYLAVPVHYLILYTEGGSGPFWTFIPVWVFFTLVVRLPRPRRRWSRRLFATKNG